MKVDNWKTKVDNWKMKVTNWIHIHSAGDERAPSASAGFLCIFICTIQYVVCADAANRPTEKTARKDRPKI